MIENKQKGPRCREAGVSLIITLFIMIIVLAVVFFMSTLLYSEIKIIRNVGDSVVSFFAADSGIEKVLYYDRQVLPVMIIGDSCATDPCASGQKCVNSQCVSLGARGLCSMYMADSLKNPNSCALDTNLFNSSIEHSIYCVPNAGYTLPNPGVADPSNPGGPIDTINGCNYGVCDDCQISFKTYFDNSGKYYYDTKATVYTDGDFEIESKGVFAGSERQIEILIPHK